MTDRADSPNLIRCVFCLMSFVSFESLPFSTHISSFGSDFGNDKQTSAGDNYFVPIYSHFTLIYFRFPRLITKSDNPFEWFTVDPTNKLFGKGSECFSYENDAFSSKLWSFEYDIQEHLEMFFGTFTLIFQTFWPSICFFFLQSTKLLYGAW